MDESTNPQSDDASGECGSSSRTQLPQGKSGKRRPRSIEEIRLELELNDPLLPGAGEPIVPPVVRRRGRGSSRKPKPVTAASPAKSATNQACLAAEGFIACYVQCAQQRTDAPVVAHELMAVGILSALVGPSLRLPIATAILGWMLVLWVMYVVDSTSGRKTTVVEIATDIIREVLGRHAIIAWEGSPQGFIQRLQDRDGQSAVFARDEYSGILQQMNRGGYMAGLAQTLIRAFDGNVLENIRTRKRNDEGEEEEDTDRVEQPYLVTLAASTFKSLMQRATIDNVLDGLLARFIFARAKATPRRVKRATPDLQQMREQLIAHARAFHERAKQLETIDVSDEVLDAHWTLEQTWQQIAEQSGRPDAAGPALKRLSDNVLKIGGLIALDRSLIASPNVPTNPTVTVADFNRARTMGERWMASTLEVIDALGETTFQRDCDAVAETVHRHPDGLKLSELYGCHRRLRKKDFCEILAALEIQDRVITEKPSASSGPGRPPMIIRPGPVRS